MKFWSFMTTIITGTIVFTIFSQILFVPLQRDRIRSQYLDIYGIDLVRNADINKQNFLNLKNATGNDHKLLTTLQIFGTSNVIIDGQALSVEEMRLIISSVKYEQSLPDYFLLFEENPFVKANNYLLIENIKLESYINDWLLFILYPLVCAGLTKLVYLKLRKKDFK